MQVFTREIGPLGANCYIAVTDKAVFLIDPGDGVNELDAFIAETGKKIDYIFVTHGHFDHMLGASHVKEKTGARLMIGAKDALSLTDEDIAVVIRGCSETPFTPVSPDALFEDAAEELARFGITVLPCPGHTEGGVSIRFGDENAVFTGDTLFYRGFGRTDFPGGNMSKLIESIRALLRLPPETMVYPGHGGSGTMEEIRKGYYR